MGRGARDEALALAARSGEAAAAVGFAWWQMHQLYRACEWSFALRRIAEAEGFGRDALRIAVSIDDRQMIVYMLALLAATVGAQGRVKEAGTLWGAVEAEEVGAPIGQWEMEREEYAARVRAFEGPEFEQGRTQGRAMRMSDAVTYALADSSSRSRT